jgi:beta-galactosidase
MVSSFIRPASTGAIIPKMGFRLEMPAAMEQLTWFGRGPWDSYRDRKEACLPAIYKSTVTDQYENYIMPQEHGTKQDVRWMSLCNEEGNGLLFVAPGQMAASAVHFRPEDNYTDRNNRKKHTYDFKTCENTVVSLDAATRGLGNASCGPDVMDKYELRAVNTSFRFFMIPLTPQNSNITPQLARVDMPVCQSVSCERMTNGRIKMSTQTSGATIYYSIDGGEYKKYSMAIMHTEACTITAYCEKEGMLPSAKMSYTFGLYINKSAWKIVSADSYQGGNEPRLAIDGNTSTFWHTAWGANEPPCPHTLIIDMAETYMVTAFTYLTRQDGNQNGMVKAYEVYLSTDGQTWGAAVATGEFKNTTSLQKAILKTPTAARYMKFVAKSEVNGNAWTSAAEVSIEAAENVTPIKGVIPDPSLEERGGKQSASEVIYDLQGRPVMEAKKANEWSIVNGSGRLQKGIYIQSGKKLLVR